MATATAAPVPPKRRRWLRVLLGIFLGLILLLVIVYFVGTSSAFFKGVILPKVGKGMNATITVSDASISPFHQVVLRDLKVQTTGAEPLLTAGEIRMRYGLMDIIGGKINVDEITISSPTVQIIENPDGTSNLDAFSKPKEAKPTEAPKKESPPGTPPSAGKPPQLDVKKIVLSNATVRKLKNYKGGGRDTVELSNVNVSLTDVKNGQPGKLTVAAGIKVDNNPPSPGTNGALQARLDGNFTLGLSAAAKPADITGQLQFRVENASGALSDVAALGATLNCAVTPAEIKEVALRFQKGGAQLGEVRVSGPFDMDKTEGRLTVQVLSIDRQVLNLVGASKGIDFGTTTISSTNQIELAKSGKLITVGGQLDVNKLSLARTNQVTPPLDLSCAYNLSLNQDDKSALLRTLTLTGNQNQRPLLRAELAGPMTVNWGAATPAVPDSALNLTVTDLNLADWKPFLGDAVTAGKLNVTFKLGSQQSGKQLAFDLTTQLDGLIAKAGSNQISQVGVSVQSRGQVVEMKKVNLEELRVQLMQQNQPVLTLAGSGQADTAAGTTDMQFTLNSPLPRLLQLMPQPDVKVSSGTLEFKSHITGQKQAQTVTGNLNLADFTGQFGNSKFQGFGTKLDIDVSLKDKLVEIRKVGGALAQGTNAGGSFDLSGNFDSEKKAGQVTLKLADLNQNALRPFLEAALGDKKLVSASINGSVSASYAPTGDAAVKADVQLAKLVVSDPKNQLPTTPLEAKVQVDVAQRKDVTDIHQFQLTLTPTQRAKNQVQLQGQIDRSQTNAIQGKLNLLAESLDVTPYYDLFANKPKSTSAAPAAQPPQRQAPAPGAGKPADKGQQEPPAQTLPFRNFPVELKIGHFYLREIEIADWLLALKLDGGHVSLNPLQLTVNGAPVKGNVELNLGVPGYEYDVNLTGDKIALEPFANTFVPDKRGLYKGDLALNTKVKGAGTTGVNLQKTLTGQVNFNLTNANIQIVSPKLRRFLQPVAVLLGIPDLLDSPLNWVDVHTEMGNGHIDCKDVILVSPVFRLESGGVMPIAEVLTNSPFQNWPVNLYLTRAYAEKAHLAAAGNEPYVKLPNFLKVAGTLGDPKAQIDKTALAGTLLEKFGNKIPGAGGVLQGIGGILSGGNAGATNQGTNSTPNAPPATNKLSPRNFLDLLKKPSK